MASRYRSSTTGPRTHQLQDADLLDEQEQMELIEQMERAAARGRRYSKLLLTILGLFVAALYLYFAAHQLLRPWQTAHQARFASLLRPLSVVAAELAGAAMAAMAVLACLTWPSDRRRPGWRSLLSGSGLLAALQAVFWSIAVWRVAEAERAPLGAVWRLLWLPVVPPLFVALMAVAVRVMGSTDADLRLLRASRYDYKRA